MMLRFRTLPRGPVIVIGVAAILLAIDDVLPIPGVDRDSIAIGLLLLLAAAAIAAVLGPGVGGRLRAKAPRIALGLVVSAVTVALALVAAEFAARAVYRDITTTSDHRGFFTKRWERHAVRINAAGFRDRDLPIAKPAGRYRIAVVGDSFAFGNGIEADARFSEQLQHALGGGFEVMNFGLPGNNTPEEAEVIRTRVKPFAPDFILVQWFVNDVEGHADHRPQYSHLLPWPAGHEFLLERSAVYTLTSSWWTRRQSLGLNAGSYADYLHSQFGNPQSRDSLDNVASLRALRVAAAETGAALGLVLFPDTAYDLGDTYPFGYLHDRVLDFCAESALTCVDLRPDFAQVKHRESLWANRMDAHPSTLANTLAAARIMQAFQPRWTPSNKGKT